MIFDPDFSNMFHFFEKWYTICLRRQIDLKKIIPFHVVFKRIRSTIILSFSVFFTKGEIKILW